MALPALPRYDRVMPGPTPTLQQPTIVALSSGAGRAGVAVIRVSGPQVRFVLETIAGGAPPPRKAELRKLSDPDGEAIDQALVLFFPSPHSFTGEDVAEFHTHGSRAVIARLLAVLAALDRMSGSRKPGSSRAGRSRPANSISPQSKGWLI